MRPRQAASALRTIAEGLDRSRRPTRPAVAADLQAVLASLHGSGDPDQPGGYSLTFEPLPDTPKGAKVLSVSGKIEGNVVSGRLTVYLEDGEFNGWDYVPDPGTADVAADPEGMLQVVLDAAADELELY